MSIQIFNMSIQVSLTLKLKVQVALELIYGIFFDSVVPTYLILQPTQVADTQINQSLFTDDRTRKITIVANTIPSKCLKFTSRYLESSSAHWVKCTFRELRSAPALLQKNSWYAKGGHKQHLFQ